jgi:hypothetical protein
MVKEAKKNYNEKSSSSLMPEANRAVQYFLLFVNEILA